MWARGSEMIWMDSAFPEAKDWVMVIISSSVVGLKKIDSQNDPDRKSLCEEGGGCIFFARLGPILEK